MYTFQVGNRWVIISLHLAKYIMENGWINDSIKKLSVFYLVWKLSDYQIGLLDYSKSSIKKTKISSRDSSLIKNKTINFRGGENSENLSETQVSLIQKRQGNNLLLDALEWSFNDLKARDSLHTNDIDFNLSRNRRNVVLKL